MHLPSSLYRFIVIILTILVIALVVIIVRRPVRLQQDQETITQVTEPGVVGPLAEPDDDGWKPLFNGLTLDGWKITNFGPQGPVSVVDSSIILSFGDGATGITWEGDFPVANYEISLDAMRISGNDFFCALTFPVEDSHCTMINGGWGGALVGISSIDGLDASENFTRTRYMFKDRQWYNIRVKVGQDAILCFIDNNEVIRVPTGTHSFSVRSEVGLSRPLGIASWHTTAALRNIRFREL
jgi:hypothetical protein